MSGDDEQRSRDGSREFVEKLTEGYDLHEWFEATFGREPHNRTEVQGAWLTAYYELNPGESLFRDRFREFVETLDADEASYLRCRYPFYFGTWDADLVADRAAADRVSERRRAELFRKYTSLKRRCWDEFPPSARGEPRLPVVP